MTRRALLSIFGAALLAGAAPVVSGTGPASAAKTSSTSATAKKKKKAVASKSKKKPQPKGQLAPAPDRIREIQTALQKDGSYEGEPTGKWDSATMDAMRKYQDKNGLNSTGKIDAPTLNKLGLGSETAGRGAPTPAASASSAPPASATTTDPPAK